MEEEGQNQALKRIRFEEEDEDRTSKLADSLLVEIISRLPTTKDAIRTAALSKRWKHLWTAVTSLVFLHPYDSNHYANPSFFSHVNKTLTQRGQSKLNKFRLHTYYHDHLHESHINDWIRYAVHCNVEDLHLSLRDHVRGFAFPLDQFVFINSCLTNLTLLACAFNPTGVISWKSLRKLCIVYGNLDEDLIGNILSGSPVLETLVLKHCYGYRRLDITSKSLKNLVFTGYMHNYTTDIIEINAPNILSLKIQSVLVLRKILLLNVSSLVEAHLDYTKRIHHFGKPAEEAEEEMLTGLILNLLHVKNLKFGTFCSKVNLLFIWQFVSLIFVKDINYFGTGFGCERGKRWAGC
uniref:Putative F-box/RNI-like superfamily protein n=1 Tax=Helianthus annuus TaxID=4232 RepID=A0A251V1L7_HELAN